MMKPWELIWTFYKKNESKQQFRKQEAKPRWINTIMQGSATQASVQKTSSTGTMKQVVRKIDASSNLSDRDKKMHLLLTTLKVVYVLTTPMSKLMKDDIVEETRRTTKWDKELWDYLESKYMTEDASSKNFLVSNFNKLKMVNSRPVMEQFNELLRIIGGYTQHGLKMDESISVSSVIDKLPPSWKDFKHTLKHGKDDLYLVQLGSHLRIEESLRAQESDKGKGKEVDGPSVDMTEEGGKDKHHKQNKVEKRTTQMLVVRERGLRTNPKTKVDAITWQIDSGAITHVYKDRSWFRTYEVVKDRSVLYIGDDYFAPVRGKGSVALEFSSGKTITLFNYLIRSYGIILNPSTWQRMLRVRISLIIGGCTQHGLKMDESISVSSVIDKLPPSCKDFKHTLKHGKDDLYLVQLGSHLRIEESLRAQESDKGKVYKRTTQMLVVREKGLRTNPKTKVDAITWWIDSGAITHVYKDRSWFRTYELVDDGSVLYTNWWKTDLFMLHLNKVPDVSDYVYMSSSLVVNFSLWHARLRHVHYKRMLEISKDDLIPPIDENPEKCTACMLTKITRQLFQSITRKSIILELIHSDLCDFHATPSLGNKKIYKTEVEFQQNDLTKTLRTDRGGEYYDPVLFEYVGIIHETIASYTPQQNGVAERKNIALKEMVNFMLSYSGLSDGFWGESMAVVRLPDPKRKALGEKGYRFYVIEPNDSVSINSIIESRDAIFDENRFSSIPRPKDILPNLEESQRDDHPHDVPSKTM
nr:zinc finger, CCHC-type [Tanacetum cinerariifolium]